MSLKVQKVVGLATVQDLGRPGRMHEGIPRGGALVPDLLAAANLALGNPPGAAAVEICGGLEVVPEGATIRVSVDGDGPVEALPGERFKVSARQAASYLAVTGGLDVPAVLGGRGTLLVAGLGGHEGRALRVGDRLPLGRLPPGSTVSSAEPLDPTATIRVIPGPDLGRFAPSALATLLGEGFTISPVGDRAGVRLEGPPLLGLASADARSAPMVPGAIQVTPSGEAIVLGPDHPTTGGYPVLAVILRVDHGAFFARRPFSPVLFGGATVDVGRRALFTRRERAGW